MHFNLFETGTDELVDHEGIDLPDLATARTMAVATARDIIAERIKSRGAISLDWCIEVTDEAGAVVLTVPFADTVTISGGQRTFG